MYLKLKYFLHIIQGRNKNETTEFRKRLNQYLDFINMLIIFKLLDTSLRTSINASC